MTDRAADRRKNGMHDRRRSRGGMSVLVTVLLAVVFALAAGELFARRDTKIVFWHAMGFHVKEIIEDMAAEYSSEHPGVTIDPVFQGLPDEMQVKMVAAAISRQLPDMAQVQFEYLSSFTENGVIDPIDDELPEEDRRDIPRKLWDLATRDGRIYAVPFSVSTTVLFYNEDAFRRAGLDPEDPPSTWEDLIRYGRKLTADTDGDGRIDQYAAMFWLNGIYGIAPFLWAHGGELFENGRVNLTSDAMINTIQMLRDLVFEHEIMPRTWTDWEGGQAFLTGKLAMGAFTSAAITYGMRNLPWRLRVAPMPEINGRRYTVIGGSGLVNFARNRRTRREVNDFILWLTGRENTTRLHEGVGYVPVRQSALQSLSLRAFHRENPNFRVPIDSLEFGRTVTYHPEFYRINEELRKMLERIILDQSDPLTELRRTER
ncbi:MAG: ABC transporter substrate-binding protein, partial [Spirochaetota bacterium]